MSQKLWKQEIKKVRRTLLRREVVLSAELAQVRETRRKLERILLMKPLSPRRRLSPAGHAAISRAAKKRWREHRARGRSGNGREK